MAAAFSAGASCPCSSRSSKPASSPARQVREGLTGRGCLQVLALFDQRAHHVRLMTLSQLRAARTPTSRAPTRRRPGA